MEKVKLSDICNPKQWKTIPTSELLEDGYPVYGANGIIGYYSEYNHEVPVVTVTCRGATCGTINVTVPKSYVTGNAMCLDDVREDIEVEYLYYCLLQYDFSNVISGSAQPQITRQGLDKVYLNIGSHTEQVKIVDRLKRIENIVNLRKKELQNLDGLIKARFVELFGDPRTNSKGFKTKKGIDLFKISNGKAMPNDKRFESGIPAYGGNGISWYTDDVLYEQDTIVIGRVGFQSGNVHLVKGPVWITDNAMYISEFYDDSLSLVFLCEMMEQIDFTKQQDAGDLKKVTQKPFVEMEYILPPKNLQSDYIAFVEQVDKSKVVFYI